MAIKKIAVTMLASMALICGGSAIASPLSAVGDVVDGVDELVLYSDVDDVVGPVVHVLPVMPHLRDEAPIPKISDLDEEDAKAALSEAFCSISAPPGRFSFEGVEREIDGITYSQESFMVIQCAAGFEYKVTPVYNGRSVMGLPLSCGDRGGVLSARVTDSNGRDISYKAHVGNGSESAMSVKLALMSDTACPTPELLPGAGLGLVRLQR